MAAKTDIEKIVLGAMLYDDENYWAVAEILSMDLFYGEDHQKIFVVINELASNGKAIKLHIVASRVGSLSNGQDPEAYLSMLVHIASKEDQLPIADYIDELRTESTRRKLVDLAEKMAKAAKDPAQDPVRTLERASERLADMSRETTIEFESTVASTVGKIYAEAASGERKGIALQPCLASLEAMIGYFPPSSLVLWGGGPGSGKTAAAMQQGLFTARTNPVTLAELEMDNRSLVARSIANETGVHARDIMRGLNSDQLEKLYLAKDQYEDLKMRIVSPPKMDINQLRARAYAHKRKFGLRLLIVDHLKLVTRFVKGHYDPVKAAYDNAFDLKQLAKDLDCTVIALCQLTKAGRQKENPEPEMEDFYGGSLEEHADIMLANFNRNLWLEKNPPTTSKGTAKMQWEEDLRETRGQIEIYKLKDRLGSPRDMRKLGWQGSKTRYYDIEMGDTQLAMGGLL